MDLVRPISQIAYLQLMDQSTAVAVAFEVENPMQQVNAANPKQSKTNKKCFTCDCCKSFSFPSLPSLPSLPSMPTCICCCGTTTSLQFFCCNSNNIIDPDHLILREERARINRLLTSDLDETKDNNCLECLLDCAFLPLLFKQPYSFHRCCCKNYCCVWIFRLFQCLFFIISTLNTLTIVAAPLMCDDTSFGFFPKLHNDYPSGPSSSTDLFSCNTTQSILLQANATTMQEQMAALADTNFSARYKASRFSFKDKFDLNSNENAEKDFLLYVARTGNYIVPILYLLQGLSMLLVYISVLFTLGLTIQPHDPNEVMYPSMWIRPVNQKPKLIRPKELVRQVVLMGGLLLGTIITRVFLEASGENSMNAGMAGLLWFMICLPLGALIVLILIGFAIHISNVAVLANLLPTTTKQSSIMKDERKEEEEDKEEEEEEDKKDKEEQIRSQQIKFEEWKELYKTTVGALHVWSWRMTPLIASIIFMEAVFSIQSLVSSIFIYAAVEKQRDFIDVEKVLTELLSPSFSWAVVWVTVFMLSLFLIALVSVRYVRLSLLVATSPHLKRLHLDDFELIQKYNAAFTLCDVPIRTSGVVFALKIIFVQVVIFSLAVALP